MNIPLLIIGTAQDGPTGVPVKPSSIAAAVEAFGGYAYQNISLTPLQTEFTIADSDVTQIEVLEWKDGLLVPFDNISIDSVLDGTVTIEKPGMDLNIVVRWLTPISSSDHLVYRAYAEAATAVPDADIWMCRVGGAKATCTIGNSPNRITLETRYHGTKYNTTTAVSTGTTLTITPPAGTGEPIEYTITGKTADALAREINTDFMKGAGHVMATSSSRSAITIPAGTTNFTGGSDGLVADTVAQEHIGQLDTRGIKVIHIAGGVYSSTTGESSVDDVITDELLADATYPTMYVQGIDYTEADEEILPSAYVEQITAIKPKTSSSLMIVAGIAQYSYEPVGSYWASAAPAYAAVLSMTDTGCIWKPAAIRNSKPYFAESSLVDMKAAGFAAFTYSLSKGWVVFSDSTTNPEWPSARHLAYLALVSAIYPILEPLVGSRISDHLNLQSLLEEAISSVESIRSVEVSVAVPNAQTITIEITAKPYGSVAAIKFGVALNASLTG